MAESRSRRGASARNARSQPDAVDRIEAAWNRERPELDAGSIGIVSRIWRVGRHLQRQRKDRLEEMGTDAVTVDVLATLRRSGAPYRRTAGELMESALITSGGVSQRLNKLEKAGLVERFTDPEDRRRVDVQLTPEGMALIDTVVSKVLEEENRLMARLSRAEQRQLAGLLRKLLEEFE